MPIHPFRGCIKNLKLDFEYVNLNRAKETIGVQSSCPNKEVRTASFISQNAYSKFTSLSVEKELELLLRFKTSQSSAHIATISSDNVCFVQLF